MRFLAAILAVALAASTAGADPLTAPRAPIVELLPRATAPHARRTPVRPVPPATRPRWLRIVVENLVITAIGTVWYWSSTSLQQEDWELYWDKPSWFKKATSLDVVRFDTNDFKYNAINHPFAAAINYQIGRANGLGPGGASLVNLASTLLWEYVVEFKEVISLNDIAINMSSGLAVGEALRQVGEALRSREPGFLSATLATATSPFDSLHDVTAPRPRGHHRWHRFEIESGVRVAWPGDDRRRVEGTIGLELEVLDADQLGRPGHGRAALPFGGWSRVEASQSFGNHDGSADRTDARFVAHTIFAGRHDRDLSVASDGLHGQERLWALTTGYTYDTKHLTDHKDRFAMSHLIGGKLAALGRRGPLSARAEADLSVDFGMMTAHVFQPDPPFHPVFPFGSALQARGYYFGSGATAGVRLIAARGPFEVLGEGRAHFMFAIDGLDRHELHADMEEEDPHGVHDQRFLGRLGVGARLGPLRIGLVADGAIRRGVWSSLSRTTHDGSLTVELAAAP